MGSIKKIDLRVTLKHLYQPTAKTVVPVDVPEMNYLMVDGRGDPNTSQAFKDAIEALYPLSYTLKFLLKKSKRAIDYRVMPLEGLWWTDNMVKFSIKEKSNWKWTLMIMQSSYVTQRLVDTAVATVKEKRNPVSLTKVRFESFTEGRAAQILHRGPFSEEGPTIAKVHQYIEECGCRLSGKHHEIYLNDLRKANPKNWRTIIRQPMR